MANKNYFTTAFANAGERTAVPAAKQTDGSLSWNEGFGYKYGLNPNEGGLQIPREQYNQLMNSVSAQILDNTDAITAVENRATKLEANSLYILNENKTWTVGTGGTYTTLKAALEAATKYVNTSKNGVTFAITINLLASYVWNETIDLRNIKLDFVKIARANTSTAVPIKTSALGTLNIHGVQKTCALSLDNASINFGNMAFTIQNETSVSKTNIQYFALCDNSRLYCDNFIFDSTAFIAATHTAVYCENNASLFGGAFTCNFDNNRRVAYDSPLPIIHLNQRGTLSFKTLYIDGKEVTQAVEATPSYAIVVENESLLYSANLTNTWAFRVHNISYALSLTNRSVVASGHTMRFYPVICAINANNSSVYSGHYFISHQKYNADDVDSADACIITLNNCTFYSKASLLLYGDYGCVGVLNAKNSTIYTGGSWQMRSNQLETATKNTFYFYVDGGSFYGGIYVNKAIISPYRESQNEFYTIRNYSFGVNQGLYNFTNCDITLTGLIYETANGATQNPTIKYVKNINETGDNTESFPKGWLSLVGCKCYVAGGRQNTVGSIKYIESDGTETDYTGTFYGCAAQPAGLNILKRYANLTTNLGVTFNQFGITATVPNNLVLSFRENESLTTVNYGTGYDYSYSCGNSIIYIAKQIIYTNRPIYNWQIVNTQTPACGGSGAPQKPLNIVAVDDTYMKFYLTWTQAPTGSGYDTVNKFKIIDTNTGIYSNELTMYKSATASPEIAP